jgi:hypothetical protein
MVEMLVWGGDTGVVEMDRGLSGVCSCCVTAAFGRLGLSMQALEKRSLSGLIGDMSAW